MPILKHIICFFDSFRSQAEPNRVSKLFSDKLRQVTYLSLLKTLCHFVGMKIAQMTDHKSGNVIISCSSAWLPLCGAHEMYCLVLSAVYRKAKTESWDWEKNIYTVIPPLPVMLMGRRQGSVIQQSRLQQLSYAWMSEAAFYPQKSRFEVKCFPSPGILLRRSGLLLTPSPCHGGILCSQGSLMSSVPPQGLDFPEDPTWDDMGFHSIFLEIQEAWVALPVVLVILDVGGHCRTQSPWRGKGSYPHRRKGTDLGQDSAWVALSTHLHNVK